MISYGRRLTQIATERPDDVDLILAARDGSQRGVSWAELESRANQVARELDRLGVRPGDIVALALPTCLEHIFVTTAVWKIGATLLPLRHDLPAWELQRLVDLAEPKALVTDVHHSPSCPVLTRAALAATLGNSTEPLPDQISESVNLIASSGSTGRPKLIVMPSRGVVADDHALALMTGTQRPVALVCSPLYHVNGFTFAVPLLLDGGRAVVMEKFDAAQAVALVAEHRITFTVMVPTMLQRVAQLPDVDPAQLASLTRVICGGSKVPEWVVDRWIELVDPTSFVLVYGSSEKIGAVMMTGAEWRAHRGATGRAQDVELSIRDETGRPVPTGEVGEVFMRPLTERTLYRYIGVPTPEPTADGFHSVGDLGRLDADGYLHIVDRRTDMIISGGANVFPAEVETALSEHPGVADQVVVGVPDDEWGQRVHAIIQPEEPEHPPTADDLREFCRARLSAYKIPKTFEVADALPRSEAGKLNRNALGEQRRRPASQCNP